MDSKPSQASFTSASLSPATTPEEIESEFPTMITKKFAEVQKIQHIVPPIPASFSSELIKDHRKTETVVDHDVHVVKVEVIEKVQKAFKRFMLEGVKEISSVELDIEASSQSVELDIEATREASHSAAGTEILFYSFWVLYF